MAPGAFVLSGRGRSDQTLELILASTKILKEIQPASVRAVCYQLFIRQIIASMAKNETNRVSRQLTYARERGVLPWEWIVDETREPERVSAWENPSAYVESVKRGYRRNRWTDQPAWIEVWAEKSTLRGALAPVLDRFGITFRVMHGYGSATAIHQAARESADAKKQLTVLYVGDWDPSGLHMSEVDLPRRLREYGGDVEIVRVALAEADTVGGLPSFRATSKQRDARYRWYIGRHAVRNKWDDLMTNSAIHVDDIQCWEVDALSPAILRERLELAICNRLDLHAWRRAEIAEAAELESLGNILSAWPTILRQAQKCGERSEP